MDLSYDKIFVTLLTGFVLAVITPLIQHFIKSRFAKGLELDNLKASFDDGIRHCNENLKTLLAIRDEIKVGKTPSLMHIKKLAIPEDLAFFVDNKTQNIKGENIALVHNVKVKARNINIEVETLIEDLKDKTSEYKLNKEEYIKYLINKNEYITRIFEKAKELLDVEMLNKSDELAGIKVGEIDKNNLTPEIIEQRLTKKFDSEWTKVKIICNDQNKDD